MAKKKYTLTQFYTAALAVLEKYGNKLETKNVFSVEIKLQSYDGKPLTTYFSVWYSNGKSDNFQCIASSNEENPHLALLQFEADLVRSLNIKCSPEIDEITV